MRLCSPLTEPCLEKNLIEGKGGMEREREKWKVFLFLFSTPFSKPSFLSSFITEK